MAERRAIPVYLSLEAMSASVKTIRRWFAAGTLPAYRCGKRAIRIKLEDLEAAPRQIPSARCRERAGGIDRDGRRLNRPAQRPAPVAVGGRNQH